MFAKGPREERVFSIGGIEKGPQGLCVSSSGKEGTGSPPTGSGHPSESPSVRWGGSDMSSLERDLEWKQGGYLRVGSKGSRV